nr:hypothetical protein [Candidatus Sigynarchaeota archaeon]
MPSIAHFFLGLMVGYFLFTISNKRFSKYHAMILAFSNYIGPDLGWVLGIGDFTHTYAGFLVFALFLAFFHSYFTRFSPEFKKRDLIDNGCNRVPYTSAFLLTCAGGLMHVYLDGVMNHQGDFHLLPAIGSFDEFIMSINNFFNFWYDGLFPGANAAVALLVGMSFVMGFILFSLHALKNLVNGKRFVLKIGAFVGAFMVLYYFLGSLTTLHAEGGAILYVTLFWVIPFGLCTAALECPAPRAPPVERGKVKQKFIPVLLVLNVIFCAFFILGGIALLVLVDVLVPLITGAWAPLASHAAPIHDLVVLLGVIFIVIGAWNAFAFAYYKTRKDINVNIMVAAGLVFIAGFISVVLMGIAFTSAPVIVDIIFTIYDAGEIITPEGLLLALIALGVVFAVLAGFNFVVGTGIILGRKKPIRFAFIINAALAWTVIGLYICCLLSQNEVKRRLE